MQGREAAAELDVELEILLVPLGNNDCAGKLRVEHRDREAQGGGDVLGEIGRSRVMWRGPVRVRARRPCCPFVLVI